MQGFIRLAILTTAVSALHGQDLHILPTHTPISALTDPGTQEVRSTSPKAYPYHGWQRSLIPLAMAQTFDIASSYGKPELNPLLADAAGRFGMQAVGVKAGATAGVMVLEYLMIRKHPKAARILSIVNWSGAAVTSGVAAYNYSIR